MSGAGDTPANGPASTSSRLSATRSSAASQYSSPARRCRRPISTPGPGHEGRQLLGALRLQSMVPVGSSPETERLVRCSATKRGLGWGLIALGELSLRGQNADPGALSLRSPGYCRVGRASRGCRSVVKRSRYVTIFRAGGDAYSPRSRSAWIAYIDAYRPPSSMRSSWVPVSTSAPSSSTRIRSARRTDAKR